MSAAHSRSGDGIAALFVRRPVLAFVLNILIVVAGLSALAGIEVREMPDVDRPVISVSTSFSGAAAETVDREVTSIVEGAVARVPGVASISSSSSFGSSRVTVEFGDGVDLNVAASDMRDAVSRVQNQLPDLADAPRIVKADADAQAVMRLAVTSPDLAVEDMTLLVEERIVDALASVPGVADVQTFGAREKIFLIDVDHAKLAGLGLTVADISASLSSMSFDVPAGSLKSGSQDMVVRATAPLATPEDFENIMLSGRTRLGDVAAVTLGPDIGASGLRSNGVPGVGLGIIRQAGSNTLDISEGVRKAVGELNGTLPAGMQVTVTSDDAVFIEGAIHEVEIALAISASLVLAVIFLFLRDWRATLIPGVSLPVALIGTLAAIYLSGFSVNILTLLALVLATGLVVDDAIVVLENVVRRRNMGLGPRAAAVLGTQEVFFAVVATTATLVAVFVPLSFVPGQTGGLFREFGFVLAIAVILSSVVALSLCPMLASRILKGHGQKNKVSGSSIGAMLSGLYRRTLRACLAAPAVVITASLVFGAGGLALYGSIKQELTPPEDRSSAFLSISAPQGSSLDYLTSRMREVESLIAPMITAGEIENTFVIAGQGSRTNSGFMVLSLAPWQKRERTQQQIVDDIQAHAATIPGIRAFVSQPNSLGIRGGGSGLRFAVAGNNYAEIGEAAAAIVADMEKDGRFKQPRLSSDTTQPQLYVRIDRTRAFDMGIPIAGLAEAMQAMLDGRKVGSVFVDDRSYDVKMVSTSDPVNDPGDLAGLFLRTADGKFVPLSSVATVTEEAVPPSLSREKQSRAVGVSSSLGDNVALGDAYAAVLEIADAHLAPGQRIIPLAEAATMGEQAGSMVVTFGVAIVVVLLVLAAQFESFVSAVIIMATVPLGLACALFAMLMTGTSLNVYSQIGLVMLVGIMAKNGILIVEFANQLRDRGLGVREAIEEASNIRLRPVMMTMLCTVIGGLPLVMASGAGAEARISLGWVIVGGLGLSTMMTLYVTPVAYLLLGRFVTPKTHEEARLRREVDEAEKMEGQDRSP